MPMPRASGRTKTPSAGADISLPSIAMLPRSGVSRPAISLSVVVLPQPLGPRMTMNSPSAISSETSSNGRCCAEALREAADLAFERHRVSCRHPGQASGRRPAGEGAGRPAPEKAEAARGHLARQGTRAEPRDDAADADRGEGLVDDASIKAGLAALAQEEDAESHGWASPLLVFCAITDRMARLVKETGRALALDPGTAWRHGT